MSAPNSLDLSCPACGQRPVRGLVPSREGAYCQCESCGHIWLEDGLRLGSRALDDPPRRRRSDGAQQPAAAAGAEGEVTQLRQRLAELERENALLRASARTFADLAERLNEELRRLRGAQ